MTDIIIKIMVEVLAIVGMATKGMMKRGRTKRYLKELMGNTDIKDSVQRLYVLTQEEARIASAELMKIAHAVDGNVIVVDDRVRHVDERVQDVGDKVEETDVRVQGAGSDVKDISKSVQGVDDKVKIISGQVQNVGDEVHVVKDRVEGVGDKVQIVKDEVQNIGDNAQGISDKVQRLDHKLDHANSSSSYNFPVLHSEHSHPIQGTSFEMTFYDGFLLPIHPSIITLLAKYIVKVPHNGSLKDVSSTNGSLLVRSCGYKENPAQARASSALQSFKIS